MNNNVRKSLREELRTNPVYFNESALFLGYSFINEDIWGIKHTLNCFSLKLISKEDVINLIKKYKKGNITVEEILHDIITQKISIFDFAKRFITDFIFSKLYIYSLRE